MPIVKNVVQLPKVSTALQPIPAASPGAGRSPATPSPFGRLSGKVTNGHVSVFASTQTGTNGSSKIDFNLKINGIDQINFLRWKMMLGHILGFQAVNGIHLELHRELTLAFGTKPNLQDDHLLAYYSLAVLNYIYPSNDGLDYLVDKSDQAFGATKCVGLKCVDVLSSIYNLKVTTIELTGSVEADDSDPVQEAYIPITYFNFHQAGRIKARLVPFVGFPNSVVLVTRSRKEIVTPPGVLRARIGS